MNFFRTHKHTHKIPNMVLRHALVLSPNKDWTDPETEAYQYLKKWALNQDELRAGGKVEAPKVEIPEEIKDTLQNKVLQRWEGYQIPLSVINEAMELSPDKSITDKRTKAYKYLKAWVLEQDNNEK